MTAEQWKTGRREAGLTQVAAARSLSVSQPYLSQLEAGVRASGAGLARKAADLYRLPPTVLPLSGRFDFQEASPNQVHQGLASLGYPAFEHVHAGRQSNPAEVVLSAVVKRDLDTRLVEALPWVLSTYTDLNWAWLRDRAKLRNAQNRLGYLVHLAKETVGGPMESTGPVKVLSGWQDELEEARLAREGTLCRDSMPERERAWLRANRPEAASHWNLLTSLAAGQLSYAAY
jgi:transcriptional regulator with XRE-family HTH domain